MERLKTYIQGLDQVLHGGIPKFSTLLLAGNPGTGKTVLAHNILYNLVRNTGVKAMYVTTISEPQIKVVRYQKQFSYFDANLFMDSVIHFDLGSVIRTRGIVSAMECLEAEVKRLGPAIVVIDSFKAISDFTPSTAKFRELVYDITVMLSVWECNAIFLAEHQEADVQTSPEAAMVDGIIFLYGTEERKFQKRFLRILKMRGTAFIPGEHLMQISESGVDVYPRSSQVAAPDSKDFSDSRHGTGINRLDAMLGGGLPAGSTTLVSGEPGTGKTLLALRWLVQGARQGQPGLLISFEESAQQILRTGAAFGWDLDNYIQQGLLAIEYANPVELDIDLLYFQTRQRADLGQHQRIAIDSLTTFATGNRDQFQYADYISGMVMHFKTMGTSLLLINKSRDLFPDLRLNHSFSHLVDNIIYFRYHEQDLDLLRLIGILKMRGSSHQTRLQQYVVTETGPDVLEIE